MKGMDRRKLTVWVALICVCGWNIVYGLWTALEEPVSPQTLTAFLTTGGLLAAVWYAVSFHLSPGELGLSSANLRAVLLTDGLVAAAGVLLLAAVKLLLLRVVPGVMPTETFWDWSRTDLSYLTYPLTVFSQEFLSQGVLHNGLRAGEEPDCSARLPLAMLILFFGAMHIHMGIVYMLCAMALMLLLGLLFRKQNSVWGLCLIHYTWGMAAGYLGFI